MKPLPIRDPTIALICESKARLCYAHDLSKRLSIPLDASSVADYLLVITDKCLELRSLKAALNPLYVDFQSSELIHRCSKSSAKEMIARAVGIKANYRPTILDTTAGLGTDAFVLASLGCNVQCLERSPIVAVLLEDGLRRLFQQDIHPPLLLTLKQVDAIDYMTPLTIDDCYDVIYLDPMFPEKKKNALPKKGMRIFRELLGYDQDTNILFELALARATKRVVVKRPRLAETITELKPHLVFEGKSSRFDVYFPKFQQFSPLGNT